MHPPKPTPYALMVLMLRHFLLTALAALLLSSCAIYKPEYQQGNVISEAMVAKIRPGMTREQVQFVLGTAPIIDPFHKDRWVYYYSHGKIARIKEQKHMTVYFDGDVVSKVSGDAAIESGDENETLTPLEVTVDDDPVRKLRKRKSLLKKLGDKIRRDKPAKSKAQAN